MPKNIKNISTEVGGEHAEPENMTTVVTVSLILEPLLAASKRSTRPTRTSRTRRQHACHRMHSRRVIMSREHDLDDKGVGFLAKVNRVDGIVQPLRR